MLFLLLLLPLLLAAVADLLLPFPLLTSLAEPFRDRFAASRSSTPLSAPSGGTAIAPLHMKDLSLSSSLSSSSRSMAAARPEPEHSYVNAFNTCR